MNIKNASEFPSLYYGLHMSEGLAEYQDTEKNFRVFVSNDALKKMNASFSGKPVYVGHVDQVDLEKIQEADGYVSESFYNPCDGKHWCKFLAVTDKARAAITAGHKLSNAYKITNRKGSGSWHNVDYDFEVDLGEYEHLAIVDNPRYEESIILTPEQYKLYNDKKEFDLKQLQNSKDKKSMFNFFKKTKLENSDDIASATVTLKNGEDVTVKELVERAEMPAKNDDLEHVVEVGGVQMPLKELVAKYEALMAEVENMKKNAVKPEEKVSEDAPKNSDDKDADDKKNAEEKPEDKMKNAMEDFYSGLKNAPSMKQDDVVCDLAIDQLTRGKSRYGSN